MRTMHPALEIKLGEHQEKLEEIKLGLNSHSPSLHGIKQFNRIKIHSISMEHRLNQNMQQATMPNINTKYDPYNS